MSDFSVFLNQLIRENGYSVYGFAQEAGVDRPTLHRVLKGQLTPSASFFQKIIKALRLFPQERERLTQNYTILKNGESIFYQRAYMKERLEQFLDVASHCPQPSVDGDFMGKSVLPSGRVACIRGEYQVEHALRQALLEELKEQEHPLVSTNLLAGSSYVGETLLQFYLEQNARLEIRHLIRFHKSIGAHMHNLRMLFDSLLFSFSPADGYIPRFYYENVSPYADPSSLFHSYLITAKSVLCFSEDFKIAALIREPEMRACYDSCFQRIFADAQPLLQRVDSLEEGYQIEEAFYREKEPKIQYFVSGDFPCIPLCCPPESLRAVAQAGSARSSALLELICGHYALLENRIKTSVAVATVDCFQRFLQTGRVYDLPQQLLLPFPPAERLALMERLLRQVQCGRVRLYLINPARFHFPAQISIHVSEDQQCVIYAHPAAGGAWGTSVRIRENTLRQALFDFTVSLPDSELVYTARESEAILCNLIDSAREGWKRRPEDD